MVFPGHITDFLFPDRFISRIQSSILKTYISIWKNEDPSLNISWDVTFTYSRLEWGWIHYRKLLDGCGKGSRIVLLPPFAASWESHCASLHNDLGGLLNQMVLNQYKDKKMIAISLPRRPAWESSQKSLLHRGLAMLLFATQPAGKFLVLPPWSLVKCQQ